MLGAAAGPGIDSVAPGGGIDSAGASGPHDRARAAPYEPGGVAIAQRTPGAAAIRSSSVTSVAPISSATAT